MKGIIDTMIGKHRIGKQYVVIRNLMMMGTIMGCERGTLTILTVSLFYLLAPRAPLGAGLGTYSAALAKITSKMY
jgi:hypothetical protein